ncbi:hypothetical protein F5Y16DRAFT_406580 [Xylariaceae sp. FL0255]|nr:hypothetical protein F5Y16DRAFT_406580 [Xylariaceae sp. FL0255]
MKLITIIVAIGLAASQVAASPTPVPKLFNIKIGTTFKQLDGKLITTDAAGVSLGEFSNGSEPITVFQTNRTSEACDTCVGFSIWPYTTDFHAIGLYGDPDLLQFVNLDGGIPPLSSTQVLDIDTFQIAPADQLINYHGGSWMAFPTLDNDSQGWQLKWATGEAIVTEDYIPVNLTLTRAGAKPKPLHVGA